MENFIVSARKYRPVTFDSVVGQATVTTTLKNAIKSNHLAQAYLFCGPRGVGKTTCARILAKTINCENISSEIEACDACESCQSFNELRSFNIHELDAASNNSVDDIRNLIEQVRIPPQVGNFSIYIIDEVHMLSAQAFNAFLKTLEEPPAHAIFILATTEKHKIIPTILSRCQIFDFGRIRLEDIVGRLQFVADKENIQAEPDALHIIALKADGAMRDALSIFDQIVSFTGDTLTYQAVIENLNVLDYDFYFKLTQTFLESDSTQSLLILDEIISKGFDPHHLITGLSSHLRDLLICKDEATIQLLDAGISFRERYLKQAGVCEIEFLFKALDILNQADTQFRISKNQRLLTEITFLRCCRIKEIEDPKKKTKPTSQSQVKENFPIKPEENPVLEAREEIRETSSDSDLQTRTKSVKDEKITEQTESESEGSTIPEPIVEDKIQQPENVGSSETEKEITTRKLSNYVPQTTSIKDGLKGAGKVKNGTDGSYMAVPGQKKNGTEPFTEEQLAEKWFDFSNLIKEERPRLAIAMKTQSLRLESGTRVVVEMENSNQRDDFVNFLKNDIQDYLREALKNDNIRIDTIIIDTGPSESKPYTEEEKFKHLSEKNPNLLTLKKQLGLDFE